MVALVKVYRVVAACFVLLYGEKINPAPSQMFLEF